jgi:nicotinate (nicotinamide) nucleotide adenylyltransferase
VLNTATHSSRPPPARAIGLLGGSFDPVHRGHLQLARDARDQLGLAEVRWLPAGQPWQKTGLTPAGHRLAMVHLALQDESRMSVDAHEIERDGPSYTIDTLRELRRALGPQVPLVLLIGGDQLERLDTWRAWDELLNHAHLAVARRNDAVLVLNDRLHAWFNTHWARRSTLRPRKPAACWRRRRRQRATSGSPRSSRQPCSTILTAIACTADRHLWPEESWTSRNCNAWSSTHSKT